MKITQHHSKFHEYLIYSLYCLKFGRDVDFEKNNPVPTAYLGSFVRFTQVIGNLMLVKYETEDEFIKVGLFKIDNKYVIDDQFEIDQPLGYSVLEDSGQIVCLHSKDDSGAKVTIMTERVYDINDTTFDIREFSMYKFSLPELAMVKGGNEIIMYNFNTKEYTYARLASSFTLLQVGKHNELIFKGLIDLGKYYVKASINFEDTKTIMSLEADLKYIVKRKLPDDKLINLLPESEVIYVNEPLQAYLLHFVNSIVTYSKTRDVKIESKKFRYAIDEVLWYNGLILYKKDSKKIVQMTSPINFNDRKTYNIIYESQDILKNVKLVSDYGKYTFYIVDEIKFLKKGSIDEEAERKGKLISYN